MFSRKKRSIRTNPAPVLKHKHVQNCKLLPERYNILELLPKNGIGAEIGVLAGDWSEYLLDVSKPNKLVLIDTFASNDYEQPKRFTKTSHFSFIKKRFNQYKELVELRKGLSWNCLKEFKDHTFDWLYIDADHTYNGVKQDLAQAKRVLKPDGCIIMNDYIMHDHVMNEEYGVVKATNEFLIENDFEMLYFALHPSMFCDVLIKKRTAQ